MSDYSQDTIKYFEQRRNELNQDFSVVEPLYRKLSELFSPWTTRFSVDEIDILKSAKKIIDSIPFEVRRNFRSGMVTGVTSEADNWFRLSIFGVQKPSLATRQYLSNVEILFRAILSSGSFYSLQPQIYDDFGVYGLACHAVNRSFENVINFIKVPIGSFRYSKNMDGYIDTFCRIYQLSASQLKRDFGYDNLSQSAKNAIDNKKFSQKFTVVHFVETNDNYDKKLPWAKNKKFLSVIYEPSQSDPKKFLSVSGYDYMPYVVYQSNNNGECNYPCESCGINALPDLNQLFSMIKDKMKTIKKKVNPALRGGSNNKNKSRENVEYYVDEANGVGVQKAYEIEIQLNELSNEIAAKTESIKKHFYNDLFAMIINVQSKGQRTATEISELKEEKVALVAPTLNQVHDGLNQLFDILFEVCNAQGLLPEPPEKIQGMEIKVELVSTLAQAQKVSKLAGIERVGSLVANIAATARPAAMNKVKWLEYLDYYADAGNFPPDLLNDNDSIEEIERQQQEQAAQQQQQQQMLQALEQGSKIVDNIGGKDLIGSQLAERFGY